MIGENHCPNTDRRTVLGTIAASATAIAGCSALDGGSADGETDSQQPAQPPSSSPIQSISYETIYDSGLEWELNLIVGLRESESVTQLNLINPDGSVFTQSNVATGSTKVTIGLAGDEVYGNPIEQTGEYTLVPIEGGTELEKHNFSISPSVTILGVISGQEDDEMDDGSVGVKLTNSGDAPAFLKKLVWKNGPRTVKQDWDTSPYETGDIRRFIKQGEEEIVVLEEFRDLNYNCDDEFTQSATVTADLVPGSDPTHDVAFEYRMVDERECRPIKQGSAEN